MGLVANKLQPGKSMTISVVFTKFENLLNDIKNRMREQEGLSP